MGDPRQTIMGEKFRGREKSIYNGMTTDLTEGK